MYWIFLQQNKGSHPDTGNLFCWSGHVPPISLESTWQDQVVTLGATGRCARSGAYPQLLRWEVAARRDLQAVTGQRQAHPIQRPPHVKRPASPLQPWVAPCKRCKPHLETTWWGEESTSFEDSTHNDDDQAKINLLFSSHRSEVPRAPTRLKRSRHHHKKAVLMVPRIDSQFLHTSCCKIKPLFAQSSSSKVFLCCLTPCN